MKRDDAVSGSFLMEHQTPRQLPKEGEWTWKQDPIDKNYAALHDGKRLVCTMPKWMAKAISEHVNASLRTSLAEAEIDRERLSELLKWLRWKAGASYIATLADVEEWIAAMSAREEKKES